MELEDAIKQYIDNVGPLVGIETVVAEYFYTLGQLHSVQKRAKELGLKVEEIHNG